MTFMIIIKGLERSRRTQLRQSAWPVILPQERTSLECLWAFLSLHTWCFSKIRTTLAKQFLYPVFFFVKDFILSISLCGSEQPVTSTSMSMWGFSLRAVAGFLSGCPVVGCVSVSSYAWLQIMSGGTWLGRSLALHLVRFLRSDFLGRNPGNPWLDTSEAFHESPTRGGRTCSPQDRGEASPGQAGLHQKLTFCILGISDKWYKPWVW